MGRRRLPPARSCKGDVGGARIDLDAPAQFWQPCFMAKKREIPPYRQSIAGLLLAAREAVLAPMRERLRAVGLTEQQWRVLRVLAEDGPTEASRLANSALLLAPSVSRIVKDLAERELIARQNDPGDARRSIIVITPTGRRMVIKTAAETAFILERHERAFGAERLNKLVRELKAFSEAIERHNAPGAPIE